MKLVFASKVRLSLASPLLLAALMAPAHADERAAPGQAPNASARPAALEYSVINLTSQEGQGVLNRWGQVAFTGHAGGPSAIGFFDGARIHGVVLPPGRRGWPRVHALSDGGVAIIEALEPDIGFPFNARALSWSLLKGGRLLTCSGAGLAKAINGRHQIAGYVQVDEGAGRAIRWNSDGSQTSLGSVPAGYSEAIAINDAGMTAGYSTNRAMIWDAQGRAIDLGDMGGVGAVASFLNARSQAAGTYSDGQGRGNVFVWDRASGLSRIATFNGLVRLTGFNDAGQVAANRGVGVEGMFTTFAPFTWSAPRGVRMLPLAGAVHGKVDALNRRAEMVGFTQRGSFDPGSKRAVYWSDDAAPVDLNTRLYRAPAGLILSAATAINDDGAILATSNAGLVLLRPGRIGTAAPVLGPLVAPPEAGYATVGTILDFALNFVDSNPFETHVATAKVSDGCPQAAPSLREVRGSGDVTLRHTFCRPGYHALQITVTDKAGNATRSDRQVYVEEATAARR